MNTVVRVLRAPVAARTWRETLHLLLGPLVSAVALASVVATAYATVATVTVVGLPLLATFVTGARFIGTVERARARTLLGLSVSAPPRLHRHRPGLVGWVRDALADIVGWRCLLYALIAAPVGVVQAYAVVLWWGLSLITLGYPLPRLFGWYRVDPIDIGGWRWYPDAWPGALLTSALGLAGILVAPWLVHGLASLDRLRISALLGPVRQDERLRVLERRRGQAVEQAGAHLRRIERDLHDGAQVRMVALAMELGRAREDIERGQDPKRTAVQIAAAHEEAKQALVELRELARGIYPAVLTDLGLDGAVPLLTARCPVPVSLDMDFGQRPDAAVEATAYFCIGELLANVAKHSQAVRASVRIRRRGDLLLVEVRDDGVGGATAYRGGGLAGLAGRVDSVDGRLAISSPEGGPTLVSVELPCAS